MAERVGFEPTVPVKVQQFSRLPDSTTLAPLRELLMIKARVGKYQAGFRFRLSDESEEPDWSADILACNGAIATSNGNDSTRRVFSCFALMQARMPALQSGLSALL